MSQYACFNRAPFAQRIRMQDGWAESETSRRPKDGAPDSGQGAVCDLKTLQALRACTNQGPAWAARKESQGQRSPTENVTGKPKGKGAIPDESGRGLLKSHLRVAANDRNTRAGTGDCP